MERLLFSGERDGNVETGSEAARRYAWDTVFNGDVRCDAEVQHYCGPHCCRDIQETHRKLQWAVDALLRPLPQIFPRKSWAGQTRAASHVLILMMVHDMLAENFGSVQARASICCGTLSDCRMPMPAGAPAGTPGQAAGHHPEHQPGHLGKRRDSNRNTSRDTGHTAGYQPGHQPEQREAKGSRTSRRSRTSKTRDRHKGKALGITSTQLRFGGAFPKSYCDSALPCRPSTHLQ